MDNVQIVVGFAELTAVQEHLGDLFDGDILVGLVQPTVEGTTGDMRYSPSSIEPLMESR